MIHQYICIILLIASNMLVVLTMFLYDSLLDKTGTECRNAIILQHKTGAAQWQKTTVLELTSQAQSRPKH